MIQMDAIWKRARADLMLRTERQEPDLFLWEHAERVARTAELLCEALSDGSRELDREAVVVSGLYQATGWVVQFEGGSIRRSEILTRSLTDLQRELAAGLAEEVLQNHVSAKRLELIGKLIRESGRRDSELPAARILSDAINLDQIGPVLLWQQIRRLTAEGRAVDALLQNWQRQREYAFWEARIKDAFYHPQVRNIAHRRLALLTSYLAGLQSQVRAEDLDALIETRAVR